MNRLGEVGKLSIIERPYMLLQLLNFAIQFAIVELQLGVGLVHLVLITKTEISQIIFPWHRSTYKHLDERQGVEDWRKAEDFLLPVEVNGHLIDFSEQQMLDKERLVDWVLTYLPP